MNDNGSLYDFAGDYEPPPQTPVKEVETPHANRQDLSKPYSGQFQQNVKQAKEAVSQSNSNSNAEWMKLICNRSTVDPTAIIVNLSFTRNKISGENFQQQKEKYARLYSELIED